MNSEMLRREILELVRYYYQANWPVKEFVPGVSPVPYAGRVFDQEEVVHLVDASLDFWLTTGRFAERFEREFAQFLGVRHAVLCNSGSSANLLAISALTSPKLGDRRLKPGDEVVTVAAGFPTTLNPVLQNKLVPVFVDVELGTYNPPAAVLEAAVGPRTRAIFLAHTLGNPFDLEATIALAKQHGLWLIEDNCDALGSKYRGRLTGTFGDLATASFYPAHHITTGEGGCVSTNSSILKTVVESFRDWGRDCWCAPGRDNTCGKRFEWQLGRLPAGYDHKYIYSHIGYNLKATDLQAAIGVAQIQKLPAFIASRKRNWGQVYEALRSLEEYFILPQASAGSDPSWFGFPITIRSGAPFSRIEILDFLESRKIATRLLFGGNLIRQPAYQGIPCRILGQLLNTDIVASHSFWIGVYPGLTSAMIDYVTNSFAEFCSRR